MLGYRGKLRYIIIGWLLTTLIACSPQENRQIEKKSRGPCSEPAHWTISLRRTGGIAGLDDTLELTSSGELAVYTTRPENKIQNIISADELLRIQDLLIQACPFETEDLRSNTCMDCFNYGFVIEMDTQIYSVEMRIPVKQSTDSVLCRPL